MTTPILRRIEPIPAKSTFPFDTMRSIASPIKTGTSRVSIAETAAKSTDNASRYLYLPIYRIIFENTPFLDGLLISPPPS